MIRWIGLFSVLFISFASVNAQEEFDLICSAGLLYGRAAELTYTNPDQYLFVNQKIRLDQNRVVSFQRVVGGYLFESQVWRGNIFFVSVKNLATKVKVIANSTAFETWKLHVTLIESEKSPAVRFMCRVPSSAGR